MRLKELGKEMEVQQRIASLQKENFLKLREDINLNKLKRGLLDKEIIKLYGEPVLVFKEKEKIKWLYKPCIQICKEKIYLYFDKQNHLCGWEYIK